MFGGKGVSKLTWILRDKLFSEKDEKIAKF